MSESKKIKEVWEAIAPVVDKFERWLSDSAFFKYLGDGDDPGDFQAGNITIKIEGISGPGGPEDIYIIWRVDNKLYMNYGHYSSWSDNVIVDRVTRIWEARSFAKTIIFYDPVDSYPK